MPSTAPDAKSGFPAYSDYLHVVVAVVENSVGELLIARRHRHLHQGGLWEFPGGKMEPGEGCFQALQRELKEELAISPVSARPLIRIPYHYPDRKVLLDVWRVLEFSGEPHGVEGQPLKWVSLDDLNRYEFPAANRPIVTAAQLPACYLITPDPGPEEGWPFFLQQIQRSLQAGISLVQLRAPSLEREGYLRLARQVSTCALEYGARLMLNADVASLAECDAAGVHLSARRLMALQQRPIGTDKLLAASCHSHEELLHAAWIGVDFALLSPVKSTATHPQAVPTGWAGFRRLSELSAIPLYALGGLSPADLPDAWQHGAQGIAAIRALWDGAEGCAV